MFSGKDLITVNHFYVACVDGSFVVESTSRYSGGVDFYMEEYHPNVEYKIVKMGG